MVVIVDNELQLIWDGASLPDAHHTGDPSIITTPNNIAFRHYPLECEAQVAMPVVTLIRNPLPFTSSCTDLPLYRSRQSLQPLSCR
jgi:hypothetical protein